MEPAWAKRAGEVVIVFWIEELEGRTLTLVVLFGFDARVFVVVRLWGILEAASSCKTFARLSLTYFAPLPLLSLSAVRTSPLSV